MSDQDFIDETSKSKRSTFLTILCILSFVGSGYVILSSATSFAMFHNGTMQKMQENQAKSLERMKESKTKNSFAIKMMESSSSMMDPEKMKLSMIFKIIAAVLTFTGAFLMFKQKVFGYGIYIIGCILGVSEVLYIYGTNNFITTITASVTGFFSVVFIILYGMCVKEMLPQKNFS
jgi:hypothetical protein